MRARVDRWFNNHEDNVGSVNNTNNVDCWFNFLLVKNNQKS